jgi:predicted nuclease of predicted toxin-antitoxin system
VKLLFDENLSRKLVVRLGELCPESAHVAEFDLLECPDREIWEFAKSRGFVIVSTDSDFYELATTIGPPPRSCGSGAGHTRRVTPSGFCAARPSG